MEEQDYIQVGAECQCRVGPESSYASGLAIHRPVIQQTFTATPLLYVLKAGIPKMMGPDAAKNLAKEKRCHGGGAGDQRGSFHLMGELD